MLTDGAKLGLAYRFKVTIDGEFDLGSFSKVDGLDVKWDVAEYRAGDAGNNRWYFPGNTKYTDISLVRAASGESAKVRKWLNSNSFNMAPQHGKITLYDANFKEANTVLEWDLRHVMPVKWSINGFDASSSSVAVETLVICHLGFLEDATKPGLQ